MANLPPEITGSTIRAALSQHGEVQSIQAETWSKTYRYAVSNGIKVVMVAITKHYHRRLQSSNVLRRPVTNLLRLW